ncbi:MAG: glutamyl-tRNA reductase [Bacteroidota bacterium]
MIHSWRGQRKYMLNEYKILTVTHKHVRLERIADFVITHTDERELQARLVQLKDTFNLDELLYVATCNRVIYLYKSSKELTLPFVTSFFQTVNPSLSEDYIQRIITAYEGKTAVNHMYEVSASIDSLVVGEREILRQVREGYGKCEKWGLIGGGIRLLMKHLVEASKQVYAQTRIGEKQISVVSLAIKKLLESNLAKDARILLVGAGQTNLLVTKFLVKHEFRNVTVFNRSIEKAEKLAERFAGNALLLSELSSYREGFDCMIVCTGATEAIIKKPIYEQIIGADTSEKLIVDLSIPNNVDRAVVEHFNINYIEIEDLKQLAEENLAFRKREIGKAKILLQNQISDFQKIFQQRQITQALQNVPSEIKAIKEKAMNEVFKKDLDSLDDNTKALFLKMMTYMEKKCISVPMKAAKELIV